MVDVSTLAIEVKSDGVPVATDRLKKLTDEGGRAEHQTGRLSKSFGGLDGYIRAAARAISLMGLGLFVKNLIDTQLQVERLNRLFAASAGNANLAAREMEYIKGVSNRLGLDLMSTTESYGKFMAAIKTTTLEGEKGRKIFESVASASTALGLRADETAGIFNALQQMISKGKVQAEELRGQLGERLPGAFRMAADAMGMTTAELDKNLALGRVMADDLLPRLAVELDKTYGKAAVEGADSAAAALNRFNATMIETKSIAGQTLLPLFTDILNGIRPALEILQMFIGGLQIMAVKAAAIFDRIAVFQAAGGVTGLLTSGMKRDLLRKQFADISANEEGAISDIMKKYTPGGSGYTVPELARQSANKPVQGLTTGGNDGEKAARAAAKALREAEKAAEDLDRGIRETFGTLEQKLQPIVTPIDRINTSLDDQIKILGFLGDEQELENQMMQIRNQLLSEGRALLLDDEISLRKKLETLQQMNRENQTANDLLRNSQAMRDKGFSDVVNAGAGMVSGGKLSKDDALTNAIDAGGMGHLFEGTQDAFNLQVKQMNRYYKQIDQLRQKDLISEQTANQMKARAFYEVNSQKLAFASDFFGNLASLADSNNKELAAIGKAAAITQATIDGILAVQKALAAYSPPYNYIAAAAVGITAAANVAKISGFETGGYTGDGGRQQVAGVVHGQEFVVNAQATARNRAALENMNRGGSASSGVVVNIENYGTSKGFEVQQISADEIRIIARDEVKQQTPKLVASEIGNPNSTISKAWDRNTKVARRR